MSFFDPVDNYCERLEAGLLAEPLNAITNAAFLIAAWCLYAQYKKRGMRDAPALFLIIMVAVVGIGSLSFHTFANNLTLFADVIPIGVFVFSYIYFAVRRLAGLSQPAAAGILVLFAAVASQMEKVPEPLRFNGSVDYFPCFAALLLIALFTKNKNLLLGAGIFAVSLFFRSVDREACPSLAIGTHFLWHLLNGLLLYVLAKALMLPGKPR